MTRQLWRAGDADILRVEEMIGPMFDPVTFFPDHDANVMKACAARFGPDHVHANGRIVASMHSWVIRVAGRIVLVDGCIGDHKDRAPFHRWSGLDSGWPARLAEAGVRREDVDYVMCTHLHVDHVGWNTRLEDGRWVPTFPNARYLFARTELDNLRALRAREVDADFERVSHKVWDDSVLPVLEAGLAAPVEDVAEVIPGRVRIEPTPGHTPGSASLFLYDDVDRAMFTGDVVHHPVQVLHPDWNSAFCEAPEQARATRRALLRRAAASGALLMPAHFGVPHAARVLERGGAFDLRFVPPEAS